MDIVLLISYLLIWGAQVLLLWLSIGVYSKGIWTACFATDIISAVGAWFVMRYYSALPGFGFMPGFSFFTESYISLGAVIAYGVVFAVSIIVCFLDYFHRWKRSETKKAEVHDEHSQN